MSTAFEGPFASMAGPAGSNFLAPSLACQSQCGTRRRSGDYGEIPPDVAAEVLFLADRTCCVCRQRSRPVQLHHIDDDPANSTPENIAVLCFDCHRETQIRGGFDRKLDAAQVRLYKLDWINRVEAKRNGAMGSVPSEAVSEKQILRYLQLREKSDEFLYDLEADYVQVGLADATEHSESAVLVAAAFEDTMRTMGSEFAGIQGRPRLDTILTELKDKQLLKGGEVGTAFSYLKCRNDSMHADWKNVQKSQAVSASSKHF
jgi:hypothetical protein